ncbi:uncharacterized protein LOC144153496 [Haemaphysalis longicornis]
MPHISNPQGPQATLSSALHLQTPSSGCNGATGLPALRLQPLIGSRTKLIGGWAHNVCSLVIAQPKPKPRPQYSTAPSSNIATPSRRCIRIPFFLAAETVELYALVEWLCCGCFEDSGLLFRRRYVACDLRLLTVTPCSGDQLACPTWWMDLSWTYLDGPLIRCHWLFFRLVTIGFLFLWQRGRAEARDHIGVTIRMFKELPTCSKIVTVFDI